MVQLERLDRKLEATFPKEIQLVRKFYFESLNKNGEDKKNDRTFRKIQE
ncbi:hypothetical protein HN681_03465 [archaeon]|jgi:hypothetical protein|nr:hypothetical protein [archaeon]MBT7402922.1 hypothetical protein [Candidatus Woesearchaeota archaeon]MBT3730817.1 hypothetical protein [archaeon]MBT4670131.1 hypothetical protein [archaeon]MBT7052618.1 hypothetical protein [archaeon]